VLQCQKSALFKHWLEFLQFLAFIFQVIWLGVG
jgi:hypothetical protein